MTLEKIRELTSKFAAARQATLSAAAELQAQIDALTQAQMPALKRKAQKMVEAQDVLYKAIEAHPELFPAGHKSLVETGIKVGYQMGKQRVLVADDDEAANELLRAHIEAYKSRKPELQNLIGEAFENRTHLIKSALPKLPEDVLTRAGITLIPPTDAVLIMPQDKDTIKSVDALIKAAQADLDD